MIKPAHYNFQSTWKINAPLEKVWDALNDPLSWPKWWTGLKEVRLMDPGKENGIASKHFFLWKSFLPYSLSFTMETISKEYLKRMEGYATGELEGTGIWTLSFENGITIVHYDWKVKTTGSFMNLIAPLGKPFFYMAHDLIMWWGGRGLSKALR